MPPAACSTPLAAGALTNSWRPAKRRLRNGVPSLGRGLWGMERYVVAIRRYPDEGYHLKDLRATTTTQLSLTCKQQESLNVGAAG